MRPRVSLNEPLLESSVQRVTKWARPYGINAIAKKQYPSSQTGKYWLEFRLGGLTL